MSIGSSHWREWAEKALREMDDLEKVPSTPPRLLSPKTRGAFYDVVENGYDPYHSLKHAALQIHDAWLAVGFR